MTNDANAPKKLRIDAKENTMCKQLRIDAYENAENRFQGAAAETKSRLYSYKLDVLVPAKDRSTPYTLRCAMSDEPMKSAI